jgi:hypothetical protein
MRFTAKIESNGKSALGFRVPPEIVEGLGRGKRPPVLVTINDHTYRSTVAVMGGAFMIGVNADNRVHAGVVADDEVEIDLQLDLEKRTVEVPPALAAELAADPDAGRAFSRLSYSAQQRHVLPILDAKTENTRQRRIAKTLESLRTAARDSDRQ